MHVLPLPFGFALALLPRREAEQLRPCAEEVRPRADRSMSPRERILGDVRYFNGRRHV
jgi:hypothetical protein